MKRSFRSLFQKTLCEALHDLARELAVTLVRGQSVGNWGWKGPSPSKRDSIRCVSCNRAAKLARFGQKNDSCTQRSDHLHIARKCWHTAYRITSISFRHVVIRDRRCFTAECAFGDTLLNTKNVFGICLAFHRNNAIPSELKPNC